MGWKLSRFRAGDSVEVRSKEEILATLDADGCLDGMPFMPEMLQYAGRRLPVAAVAHKTCDVAQQTLKARRLDTSVHLAGARCDGSAHGGCQAACNLFWKDAWLKPGTGRKARWRLRATRETRRPLAGISESQLLAATRPLSASGEPGPAYSCQATKIFEATKALAWWNPLQYTRDVITGNHSLKHVIRVLLVSSLRNFMRVTPTGYRLVRFLYVSSHRRLFGRELPSFRGKVPTNTPTPTVRLDLQPGERVRIKSKEEIELTLDVVGKNRGMYYGEELSPYCGSVRTVTKTVTQFIDEATGVMRYTKTPCVMLDGAVCKAEYSRCRLLCPREINSWWREAWLERVDGLENLTQGAQMDIDTSTVNVGLVATSTQPMAR
jgi:hypothetical protein